MGISKLWVNGYTNMSCLNKYESVIKSSDLFETLQLFPPLVKIVAGAANKPACFAKYCSLTGWVYRVLRLLSARGRYSIEYGVLSAGQVNQFMEAVTTELNCCSKNRLHGSSTQLKVNTHGCWVLNKNVYSFFWNQRQESLCIRT